MTDIDIISGEKLQELCDIYIGHNEDFMYNPRISRQMHKHLPIQSITFPYNNPPLVFCYSHRLEEFEKVIHTFQNKFVLLSHNSDYNISEKFRL